MFTTIDRTTNAIEAHIIRGHLEAEGIPAFVAHEHHIWARWDLSNALGGVKIQIFDEQLDDAKHVLNNIHQGIYTTALEDEWGPLEELRCPVCDSIAVKKRLALWRTAFLVLWMTCLTIPFRHGAYRCRDCGRRWVEDRARPAPHSQNQLPFWASSH